MEMEDEISDGAVCHILDEVPYPGLNEEKAEKRNRRPHDEKSPVESKSTLKNWNSRKSRLFMAV
jgi:hypothetical protein